MPKRITDLPVATETAAGDVVALDNITLVSRQITVDIIKAEAKELAGLDDDIVIVNSGSIVSSGINLGTTTTADLAKLNAITATATELNKLDGATVSTAEINYLSGTTANIQSQISDLYTIVGNNILYAYTFSTGVGETTHEILETAIRAGLTLPGSLIAQPRVSPTMLINIRKYVTGAGTGNLHIDMSNIDIQTTTIGVYQILSKIYITGLTGSTNYVANIYGKVFETSST